MSEQPHAWSHAEALALLSGIKTFPCRRQAEVINGEQYGAKSPHTIHGFKDASADADQLERWRKQYPDALIGVATGPENGFWVLDIDPCGCDWYEEHKEALACSRTQQSMRGFHLYYLATNAERDITTSAGDLPEGVDVRGHGGYVIAWDAHGLPAHGADLNALTPAPEWLTAKIRAKKSKAPRRDAPRADTFFRAVNDAALQNLGSWFPDLFSDASESSGRWRISSESLGRDLEEDISATPEGIQDFGEEHGRTAIDLVMRWLEPRPDVATAALWLCTQMQIDPATMGWKGRFPLTEIGNAKRLAAKYRERLRYAPNGGFLVHDGPRWIRDEQNVLVQGFGVATATGLFDEIKTADDKQEAFAHAKRSQTRAAVANMVHLVRSEEGIATNLNAFDTDPMLLNLSNGTLDLRTGQLREHRREDLITRLAPIAFDPAATCRLWVAFLDRISGADLELIGYLQRVAGYLLTGTTTEQVLFFLYGGGANGKTVFSDTLIAALGEYASVAQTELVMARRHAGIGNDVVRLKGTRAAFMNETNQGAHFDEARLKDMTGGDKLTGRFLYQEQFDFTPTHKLVIRGNHKPLIRGTDDGIWRRLHLIPFTVRIPDAEKDPQLKDKLLRELPGILNWALHGCLEWQRVGLQPPGAVVQAVAEYRAESDALGRFIAERTEADKVSEVQTGMLYSAYRDFCVQNGEQFLAQKEFPSEMERHGFTYTRNMKARVIRGIRFKALDSPESPDSQVDDLSVNDR